MRKGRAKKRILLPDPKFRNTLITRFVNNLMLDGKKDTAYQIFYDAMDIISTKVTEEDAVAVWEKSLENVIKILKTNYENQWKKINQINTSIRLPLTLSLNSKNYELIIKFEKHLAKLDLVSNYYIDNFSSEITIYKIIYNSTPDKFIQEIENEGLKLDTSYKIWRVQ